MCKCVCMCVCACACLRTVIRTGNCLRERLHQLLCPCAGSRQAKSPHSMKGETSPAGKQRRWEGRGERERLGKVGDGMERRVKKSLCSVSSYSALLCHSAPLFFMLSFTLLGLVALPHLVSKYQSLCPATHPSLRILSSFLVALFMISSLCFICPSSPCFSLLLPLSLSLSQQVDLHL